MTLVTGDFNAKIDHITTVENQGKAVKACRRDKRAYTNQVATDAEEGREILTGSTKQQEFLVEENLPKVSRFTIGR